MTTQTVEWISASVKLPDPKINVLLWEWWYEDDGDWNEPKIDWYEERYWFRTYWDSPIVTHWMPLPNKPI